MTTHASWRNAESQAGFTLVELLVATTLLAFLTVLLFGGLRFGGRAWQSAQAAYDAQRAMHNAQTALSIGVGQAYPLPVAASAGHVHLDFDGRAHELTWLSAAPTASGAMSRLHLFLREDTAGSALDLSRSQELAAARTASVQHLVAGVSAFDISYFGRRLGDAAPRWGGDWRDQPRLPQLVRFHVRLAGRRGAWRDFTVAPRIGADVNCVLDGLTNDCAGR